MRIFRLVVALVGVVMTAWFVLGARQAHEIKAATTIVARGASAGPRALAQVQPELSAAAVLNPDSEIDILRGRAALSEGRSRDGRQILAQVARSEPLNLDGWIWLAGASLNAPREARIAGAHLAELDPLDAG